MKTFKELETLVIQWGEERNLYCPDNGATVLTQTQKFFEEFGELNEALLKKDSVLLKDSIGDCQVCLISIAKLENEELRVQYMASLEECLNFYEDKSIKFKKLSENERYEIIYPWLFEIVDELRYDLTQCVISLDLLACVFGFKPFECLEYAYNEIKDRKGSMVNRVFVKDA